ncbi:hypothetical protein FQN57_001703 [Myotisia sp. PD_48]|nr:hypothetical protein FQN57_001703 [Myotisia sp. PD_48]
MASSAPRPPKHGRILSFGSGKSERSHHSSGSGDKIGYADAAKNPAIANRKRTHADPTLAINEAQPATIALEKSNLASLRAIQHKDRFGNLITDPDLSNPTRHRLERPLETIRSFEAAIEGTNGNKRQSYARPDRGGHHHQGRNAHYNEQNGQYGARGYQSRPESYVDAHGNQPYYGNQHSARPRHGSRMNPDQQHGQHRSNYPQQQQPEQQVYHQSADNPTSAPPPGSRDDSVDHWVDSTDPSSLSSSIEALAQQQQQHSNYYNHQKGQRNPPDEINGAAYGLTDFGNKFQLDQPQHPSNYSNPHQAAGTGQPTPVQQSNHTYSNPVPSPPKKLPVLGTLLKKEKSPTAGTQRKSWFRRTSKS